MMPTVARAWLVLALFLSLLLVQSCATVQQRNAVVAALCIVSFAGEVALIALSHPHVYYGGDLGSLGCAIADVVVGTKPGEIPSEQPVVFEDANW